MNNIGGYTFKDEKLMLQALTHSSYSANNYERLEFLGDSILDFLIADILFKDLYLKEENLTRARANIVSEESLSKVFDKLNIENFLRLGKSTPVATRAIKCDVVESLIAVVYLESGLDGCLNFINKNFDLSLRDSKDYKTKFQEFAQKRKLKYKYVLEKTEGPAHKLTFYVGLFVNDNKISSAIAASKAAAEKECAKIALEVFKQY